MAMPTNDVRAHRHPRAVSNGWTCRDLGQVAQHVHDDSEIEVLEVVEGEGESKVAVNKLTWAQVGRVTEPGRYMFKFGWLTITADDLAIWKKYPTAAFTLYSSAVATTTKSDDEEVGDEFRLGTCELRSDSNYSKSEK
jgi:hypothetical protein